MNRMQLMSVAFLFMGVGTLSAQTEPTKEASPWTREWICRVEIDPGKFNKLGCRWRQLCCL